MLAAGYVLSLLFLQLPSRVLAINTTFRIENAVLLQNNSTPFPAKSSVPGISDAGPSRSDVQSAAAATLHLPISSPLFHTTPIGQPSVHQSTHTPVLQRPSPPVNPFPHHPPSPTNSTFNSSDTPFHPFHPHPPPSTPSPHASSPGLSVTQIFFAALGGVVGLAILLAVARCIFVYRRTPPSTRPPTPEVGEVERTLSLLRPGRIFNLGDRIIPPPPYQPAPDYDTAVSSGSGANESTNTQLGPNASTTGNLVSTATQTIDIPGDSLISESSATVTPATDYNAMLDFRLPESIPSNLIRHPSDIPT